MFLEKLTWTELRDLVAAGKATILVPIGGTEQNGPDMALGKHNMRAHLLAETIARTLGNALVAPVIAYVPEGGVIADGAIRFPGTITVPDDVFEKTVEYAARSFRLHGFTDIVFLGDHGGYQAGRGRRGGTDSTATGPRPACAPCHRSLVPRDRDRLCPGPGGPRP